MIWVELDAEPLVQLYADPAVRSELDANYARLQLLDNVSTIRSDVDGEAANVTITLINMGAEASELLTDRPPLGASVRVVEDGVVLFSGLVSQIRLAADVATLQVEA